MNWGRLVVRPKRSRALRGVLVGIALALLGCPETPQTPCVGGDHQCPAGCGPSEDSDCGRCGDGTVAATETCDTGITSGAGACPTSCPEPANACAAVALKNAGTCTAVCEETRITACVSGDGCCPAGCAGAGDTDCSNLVDTSGTWAVKIETPGHIKTVSSLGITLVDADVTITAWLRDSVSADGTIVHRICKMTTESPTMKNTYSQALFDTLVVTLPQARETHLPIGGAVSIPPFTIVSGEDGKTPKPSSVDSAPVGDGDGKPGVTVHSWTQTLNTSIDVYIGLVLSSTTSDVVLSDATTMTGMTSFSSKGYVFDSSQSLLVGAGSTVDQTTKAALVSFTSKKLDSDGSHDCAYIVGNL